MKKLLSILPLLICTLITNAQFGYEQELSSSLDNLTCTESYDLDGDGDIDILSSSSNDNKVCWYKNLGNNKFSSQIIIDSNVYTLSYSVNSVFAADLDGDGDLDVITNASSAGGTSWYENYGGIFGQPQLLAPGGYVVYANDIDGDGDVDVIKGGNQLYFIENTSGGSFLPEVVIPGYNSLIYAVDGGDFDNDGDIDLVTASSGNNRVTQYVNIGSGSFSDQLLTLSVGYVRTLDVGDIENDGDLDIIAGGLSNFMLVKFTNLGSGVFTQAQNIPVSDGIQSAKFIDVDGDNDLDIVTGTGASSLVDWYEYVGGGTYGSGQTISIDSTFTIIPNINVCVDDMDGDGDIDVIVGLTEDIVWHENQGGGIFGDEHIVFSTTRLASKVCAADIDNDGDNDVIFATSSNKIGWYENFGGGIFGAPKIINTKAGVVKAVSTADIDGDGDLDILFADWSGNKIAWHENLNGGIFGLQHIISDSVNQVETAYPIDIDGDGDIDVLSGAGINNRLALYKNLGGGIFSAAQYISPNTSTSTICSADFNGDGRKDVIYAGGGSPMEWYSQDLAGNFVLKPFNNTNSCSAIYANDIDADGDMDILSANYSNISWFKNLGSGVFGTEQIISSNVDIAIDIYAADLDGDGDADVIAASANDDKIAWYENIGGGIIDTTQHIISINADWVQSVYASDIDGDGDIDVISASRLDDKIAWYENLICEVTSFFSFINNSNGNYSFTNTSTGNFNKSHWAFGDGTTSTVANPNHTFSSNGTYVVILTVNDSTVGNSCIDYYMDTIVVTGVLSPLQCAAGFVVYPDTAINNITVVNSSTGSNLTYFWDFGDGNTSTLQTPSHTYSSSGSDESFLLCLTVDDGVGCNNTFCDSIGQYGVVFNKQTGFTINVIAPPIVTGLENNSVMNSLVRIYPNPTSTILTIETKLAIKEVVVADLTGKIIKLVVPKMNKINVSDLSNGIYFIKIVGEENTIIQKFVKQ